MVLSVSPSDRSCRVQRDWDNRTFLLNRRKLVRDPAFTDDDVVIGGAVSSTPGGSIASPRDVLRGDSSQEISPVQCVRQHLQFEGLHQIPDSGDGDLSQPSGRIWDPGEGSVVPALTPPGEETVVPVSTPPCVASGTPLGEQVSDVGLPRAAILRP